MEHKLSADRTTLVSKEVEWQHLDDAPLGVTVFALTKTHVGLVTSLSAGNLAHFSAWLKMPDKADWLKMEKAPLGVKVYALTVHNVPVTALFGHSNLAHFRAWLPLPKKPKWLVS